MSLKVIQPMTWAGQTVAELGQNVMVCGGCETPRTCYLKDRCAYASDEDYQRRLTPEEHT